MKQCHLCQREFPNRLLAPLHLGTADGWLITLSCPICALRERNKHIGLPPDSKFSNPEAKKSYYDAIMYLRYTEQIDI